MPAQKTDRESIIRLALRRFKKRGFHQTSMAEIAADAGLLKGSLYHYFRDKDELALAVVTWVEERFAREVFSLADRTDLPPAQRWRELWQATDAYFAESEGGCLLGNLTLEVGLTHPSLAKRCAVYFEAWQSALARLLATTPMSRAAARAEAARLVAEVQGLLLLERLQGQPLLRKRIAELAQRPFPLDTKRAFGKAKSRA